MLQLHCVAALHHIAQKLQCNWGVAWKLNSLKLDMWWSCGDLRQKVIDISAPQHNCGVVGRAGWRSGCSRAFHQCGPGSIPSRVRVVCEFGSQSILARAGFLRALRFPPAPKIVSSFHISLKIHFWRRPLNLVHNALLGRAWLFAECYK